MPELHADQTLCLLSEIPDPGSKGVNKHINGACFELLVVRKGEVAFAYVNSCPHTGGPLDWLPDMFLDENKEHIMCSTHAALFRIEDGYCLSGPCAGQSLMPVKVYINDGMIFLSDTDNAGNL